jgi:hypothetical protein
VLGAIVIAAAILIWWMPAERTLGQGVKVVYAHVGLTQAGTIGLYLAGLLGLAVALLARNDLDAWMQIAGRVGLGFYAAGFGVSLLAQAISWGGIAWREPRVAVALNVLAAAAIVQIVGSWLRRPRVRGVLNLALAGVITWAGWRTPNVLHPGDAIGSSPSLALRLAALGLLALCLLAEVWIAWNLRQQSPPEQR